MFFFPFNPGFEFFFTADGGTSAGSAAPFDEHYGEQVAHAAAAFDGVQDSYAVEADLGRDLSEVAATEFKGALADLDRDLSEVATDFKGALNSEGDGDATSTMDVTGSLACASGAFGSEDALNWQEFGVAAIAVEDDGGTAVAFSVIESEDAPNSEVHRETATVLGGQWWYCMCFQ